jgi:APA family basic amino acid/polyamine antiporter
MTGPPPALRRELGLFEVTMAGIGVVLGAGIYALLGKGAGLAGNAVWLSFVISAVMAVFSGLSYAELSSIFPRASAEYEYVQTAIGHRTAFVIGWLVILAGIFAVTTVALGFAGYFMALTGAALLPVAAVLIVLCGILLFTGIKETALFTIVFTLIEAGGIIVLIIIGLPYLGQVDYLEMPYGWSGVFEASALVFFAYTGFEGIVKLSEETKNPEKTIPRGLILSLLITIILYVFVAIASVSVIGWQKLSASGAPFAEVVHAALGSDAFVVIGIIALFATANTALMFLLAASRITYGMAGAFFLPRSFSRVHSRRQTPWVAITVVTAGSLALLAFGDIAFVANVTNFTLFVTFIVINASVIILRFSKLGYSRPFRVPVSVFGVPVIPMMGILFCVFLLMQQDIYVILLGILLAVTGILLTFLPRRALL